MQFWLQNLGSLSLCSNEETKSDYNIYLLTYSKIMFKSPLWTLQGDIIPSKNTDNK